MIFNTQALVLSRKSVAEYDCIATVFTQDLGKMSVRFSGVSRPKGKLKVLCDLAVLGEYRLHLSHRSEYAKCIGGKLMTSFPGMRFDIRRIIAALYCCEFLNAVSAEHVPSPEKFDLLIATLTALEVKPNRWLTLAYGLKLLELAGFSMRELAPRQDKETWLKLHQLDTDALEQLPFDHHVANNIRHQMETHFEFHVGRELKVAHVRDELLTAFRTEGVYA